MFVAGAVLVNDSILHNLFNVTASHPRLSICSHEGGKVVYLALTYLLPCARGPEPPRELMHVGRLPPLPPCHSGCT